MQHPMYPPQPYPPQPHAPPLRGPRPPDDPPPSAYQSPQPPYPSSYSPGALPSDRSQGRGKGGRKGKGDGKGKGRGGKGKGGERKGSFARERDDGVSDGEDADDLADGESEEQRLLRKLGPLPRREESAEEIARWIEVSAPIE